VSWARSGDEGLALARQPAVDLAIVDVMLPGRDGLSIIRALRESEDRRPHHRAQRARHCRGSRSTVSKPAPTTTSPNRSRSPSSRARGASDAPHSPLTERPSASQVADLTLDRRRAAGAARRPDPRAAGQGVRPSRVPDAQSGPRPLEDDDPAARVGLSLRSADQRGRRPRESPSIEDRSSDFPQKLIHTIRGVGYVLRTNNEVGPESTAPGRALGVRSGRASPSGT
jgi:hypothetical protein